MGGQEEIFGILLVEGGFVGYLFGDLYSQFVEEENQGLKVRWLQVEEEKIFFIGKKIIFF